MTTATRIRASFKDGITELRMLMNHPMESGLRKDGDGNPVPAHFITEVSVRHRGRTVLTAAFGPSIARNPYLALSFGGGAVGDDIEVSWRDSRGDTRSDTVAIA